MQNQEISRQLQRLRELFKRTNEACGGEIEMQAHWARYLCVLSAGLLENAVKEIYKEFAYGAASAPVAGYVSDSLSKLQNPKTTKFIEIAGSFKKTWAEELTTFVDDDGRKEAIDSIMTNRHLIAHGKDSGVTLISVKEYLDKAVQVLGFIEEQTKK